MKRYLKDFNLTLEFVKVSIFDCLNRQRWTRRDTSVMLAEYKLLYLYENGKPIQNKIKLAREIQRIARKDRTQLYWLVDYISLKIYDEIINKKIHLDAIRYSKELME